MSGNRRQLITRDRHPCSTSRSVNRYRRAALTALGMMGARGIASLTAVLTVPLTLTYLGVERYGMWMTISSFIALMTFADLGLGNGLLTAVSHAQGRADRWTAARQAASAAWMLSIVGAVLLGAFSLLYGNVDWSALFNVRTIVAAREAGPAMAVFAALIALGLPLGVAVHLRSAYQEGYIASLYVAAGNLLGFVGVVLCVWLRQPLPMLVLAMLGGPTIASVANLVGILRTRPWLVPRWSHFDPRISWGLLRSGSQYLVLQTATAMAFGTHSLIAAQVLGASSVAAYAVAFRLFLVPSVIVTAALYSLWPAYAEAMSSGDLKWVTATFRRSLWLSMGITVPLCGAIAVTSDLIVTLWIADAVMPPPLLVAGMAVWTVLNGLGTALTVLLNALHALKAQIASWVIMAIANVALSLYLAGQIGVSGVVWGSVIAFPLFTLIPMGVYVWMVVRKLQVAGVGEPSAVGAP